MKLFFSGRWSETDAQINVTNPFDGSVVDSVPKASAKHVDQALDHASGRRPGDASDARL